MALSTLNRFARLVRVAPPNSLLEHPCRQLLRPTGTADLQLLVKLTTRSNRRYFHSRLALSLCLGGLGVVGLGSLLVWGSKPGTVFSPVHAANVFSYGRNGKDSGETRPSNRSRQCNFIADVVEIVAPGVVYIEIQGRHPFTGSTMTLSNGSGFIVREDGVIVTNAHVVANKPKVVVKLHDGRVLEGVVRDVDLIADLAIITVKASSLPTLRFGRSAALRPGEWVVALGSPLSLSNTVTAGVVSSTHRGSQELGLHNNRNMEYIQTDASITVGNSGGPLVNLDGDVIGINTMKLDAGISFAIPSDVVQDFLRIGMEKLDKAEGRVGSSSVVSGDVKGGQSRRRYVGITMITLTPSIISQLQQRQRDFPADVTSGVLIYKVIMGSPANSGGLLPGDVVLSINGSTIGSADDVYKAITETTEMKMVILRNQQRLTLTIKPQDSE